MASNVVANRYHTQPIAAQLLRVLFRTPPITPAQSMTLRVGAAAMQLALYLFLVVMPLLGWLTLSAKGASIPFFGLQLPTLIGPDKALSRNLEDIHETIGTVGYYLVGTHAAAALFHHHFMRDDVLLRMLPRGRRACTPRPPVHGRKGNPYEH